MNLALPKVQFILFIASEVNRNPRAGIRETSLFCEKMHCATIDQQVIGIII